MTTCDRFRWKLNGSSISAFLTVVGVILSLVGAYTAIVIEFAHIQADHASFSDKLDRMDHRVFYLEQKHRP